jgi:nudix-type nucleoside diphosphatase (YffH/AdpP family)
MTARIIASALAYEGYTTLSRVTVEIDGEQIHHEVEDHGDAVAVLPYDLHRGVGMLVRAQRVPVLTRTGDISLLEAPAGLVEAEEDAEACARREALEETGLRLNTLEWVARLWSSPGISTERVSLYLAPYGAEDRVSAGGGLAQEGERLEPVEIDLWQLWKMLTNGDISDMKTYCLVTALVRRHAYLFEKPD